MSTNPQYGRTETPINRLESIEIDFTAGQPLDPSEYGRAEAPINLLEAIEVDFAVPHLVLTLRFLEQVEAVSAEILALDVLNLVRALGEYEKGIGGRGLRLHDKAADAGAITLTLAPVAVDKALDRLNELAGLLDALSARVEKPISETPVLEAFTKLERSPAEQCRAAFARRPWSAVARVAMPA